MTDGFSRAICKALTKRGVSSEDLQRSAGVSAAVLSAIVAGQREFTERQLDRIEEFTGQTAGQLASAVLGNRDDALSTVLGAWAEVRKNAARVMNVPTTKPRRRSSRRPSLPANKPKPAAGGASVR